MTLSFDIKPGRFRPLPVILTQTACESGKTPDTPSKSKQVHDSIRTSHLFPIPSTTGHFLGCPRSPTERGRMDRPPSSCLHTKSRRQTAEAQAQGAWGSSLKSHGGSGRWGPIREKSHLQKPHWRWRDVNKPSVLGSSTSPQLTAMRGQHHPSLRGSVQKWPDDHKAIVQGEHSPSHPKQPCVPMCWDPHPVTVQCSATWTHLHIDTATKSQGLLNSSIGGTTKEGELGARRD